MTQQLAPGLYVRHPDMPDWGIGQVQSVIGNRITVNFENAGKQTINVSAVPLIEIDLDESTADESTGAGATASRPA